MEQYSYENAVYQAGQHVLVHQYTTLAALDKIISNKSLRLTRIDLLNDTVENERIAALWQKKVFVSCFTHRESESYFFWKTYAKGDSTGLRLSLDPSLLCSLPIYPDEICEAEQLPICKKTIPGSSFSDNVSSETWGIYDVSLVDIIYISRNQSSENIGNYQGIFKYVEWDSEKETRLCVAIKPKRLEFRAKGGKLPYLTPNNEYLYIKLSDACLEHLIITLSPFASNDLKAKVEEILRKNNLIDKIKIYTSVLTGESR